MAIRRLEQLGLERRPNTRVLLRVDFNVPLERGHVADDTRIRQSLDTIRYLREQKARVVLMSHLGRPKGKRVRHLSLGPVAQHLEGVLGIPVRFCKTVVGEDAEQCVQALGPGDVALLENLRFDPREEANDPEFARELARLGDAYVNDAFGTAHRAHASTVGLAGLLPSAAGRLMERELEALRDILGHPQRPYWAIVGGAKVSDKLELLKKLLEQVDGLVIGGGMANTFLAAEGVDMAASRVEEQALELARDLLAWAKREAKRIVLPTDVVAAEAFREDAPHRTVSVGSMAEHEMALDIGPDTVRAIEAALGSVRTVFWNGPMGVFEWLAFAEGTMAVAHLLADLDAQVVVGGGDSVRAVAKAGVAERLSHISTGGGAALEFLEGRTLPGVAVLLEANKGGAG